MKWQVEKLNWKDKYDIEKEGFKVRTNIHDSIKQILCEASKKFGTNLEKTRIVEARQCGNQILHFVQEFDMSYQPK